MRGVELILYITSLRSCIRTLSIHFIRPSSLQTAPNTLGVSAVSKVIDVSRFFLSAQVGSSGPAGTKVQEMQQKLIKWSHLPSTAV